MSKIRQYSFPISCFLIVLAVAGFCAVLFLALRSPVPPRPELHQQLVKIEPDGPGEDGADVIYQKVLSDERWSQPVCAIVTKRNAYSVYLDGELLHEYIPGSLDHGGLVHWISLPDTDLEGRILTVSSPSQELTVQVGNYSDLILHYRNTNVATLFFSGLFLVLGILIGLLSLGPGLPLEPSAFGPCGTSAGWCSM